MGDPTGLSSWALAKALDTVIDYVNEARKYYDHSDDLEQLLRRIKPLLSDAISTSLPSASPVGDADLGSRDLGPVDNWLIDLKRQLEEASATLQQALASNPSSFDIFKKKRYSDRIRDITEGIRKVMSDGESLATLVEVRKVKVAVDHLATSSWSGLKTVPQQKPPAPEHPLVSRLKELWRRSGHDARCSVKLEVANTHTPNFHVPGEPWETLDLENRPPILKMGRIMKIARGGFEVNNATKLRLTIRVEFEDDWYFYILFVDLSEGSHPMLFFPEEAVEDSNSLNRMRERVFPNYNKYEDDPPNVKLIRSSNSPTDALAQVSLYLLVVRSRVQPDDVSGKITIQDVENHLHSLGESDIIVKNWLFDIKPPHSQN